jgi:exosortase
MSSVANPVVPQLSDPPPARQQVPWAILTWFFFLLVLSYGPVLMRLVNQWNNDEDMGHGFFVPLIAGYIAWQRRDRLLGRNLKPNYWGLAVIIFAGLQMYIGTLGAELFLARTAFVEAVIGTVLFFGGTYAVRAMVFPLVLLFFMIPIPAVIYNRITFPLQLFASEVAAHTLEFIGIPVLRDGNVLELASQKLSVVEACSGIRSLLSLTFLSLVYGYFFDSKRWMRVVLFFATIPIAILANAGRVTLTGIMSEVNPELAHGAAHTASGWLIFMIALAMMIITHQVINRVYHLVRPHAKSHVEVADAK